MKNPNNNVVKSAVPTPEEYAALLAKVTELQSKVDRKKRQDGGSVTDNGLKLVAAEKGGVSVYGLGRFPVTLYPEQMLRLLDAGADIRTFIADNKASLKFKPAKDEQAEAAAA
jgi:hypothetical protein